MSFMINPYIFSPSFIPAFITHQGNYTSIGGSDTWSSVSIGAANANRMVFVVHHEVSTGSFTDGMTIGGITAQKLIQGREGAVGGGIYAAKVPTGTTVDIVRNATSGSFSSEISVYTANCLESASELIVDTDFTIDASPLNVSVMPFSKANVLTVGGCQNGTSGTLSGVDVTVLNSDLNTNEWFLSGYSTGAEGNQNISHSGFTITNFCFALAACFPLTDPASIVFELTNTLRYVGGRSVSGTTAVGTFNIGPEDADRICFIALGEIDISAPNITSVTIGGVSASKFVDAGTPNSCASIWAAKVPTGNTAAVVINESIIATRCDMWIAKSSDSVATIITNSVTDSGADTGTINLSVTPSGTAELISVGATGNSSSISVTGVDTEVFNGDISTDEFISVSFSTGKTGQQDVDYTIVGSTDTAAVVAAIVMS